MFHKNRTQETAENVNEEKVEKQVKKFERSGWINLYRKGNETSGNRAPRSTDLSIDLESGFDLSNRAVMLGVLAVMAVVECRQGTTLPTMEAATPPQTQDKSTLRQLVDPKFRRTLLKVLNKLGGNDRVGETDVTDDEFLRLVGQKASAEDLGTVEESREQGHSQDTYPSQEFNYLPPPTDSPQQQPEGKHY
ncbi:hypothetical protein AAG570_010536 [Ranatra chinensis]|uniref:Uncharacterized protein n=1 Tax=Ranatra chinensis TaxID=642074 RepID=A0ABD0ZB48_9HEMI